MIVSTSFHKTVKVWSCLIAYCSKSSIPNSFMFKQACHQLRKGPNIPVYVYNKFTVCVLIKMYFWYKLCWVIFIQFEYLLVKWSCFLLLYPYCIPGLFTVTAKWIECSSVNPLFVEYVCDKKLKLYKREKKCFKTKLLILNDTMIVN